MRPSIGIKAQGVRKRFVDTFTRLNTDTTPGVATDGSLWSVLSGTFNISNNLLNTVTSASSYPMQTIDMGVQNVSLEVVSPGQGTMAALWVTDAGNWWGVQTFSQPEDCNCSQVGYSCNCGEVYTGQTCSTCYYAGSCSTCYYGTYYCTSGSYGTYYCSGGGYTPGYCVIQGYGGYCLVSVGGSYTAPTCYADTWSSCSPDSYSCGCTSGSPYSCNCTNNFAYSCSTCFYTSCGTCYPQYFKIIKNISGTISSVWSQAITAIAAAFRVKTSGDTITIQAYSDQSMATKIGSDLTYTATGSVKSTKFGLAIAPSSYNQTSTISKITIDRN